MFDSALSSERPAIRIPAAVAVHAHSAALRTLLLAACFVAISCATWLGNPEPTLQADAELARLLRGMALIKASIALAVIGVLTWRFGRPISRTMAAIYIGSTAVVAGSSTLIWQLTHIPVAAVAFHIGELALLVAAWRDTKD